MPSSVIHAFKYDAEDRRLLIDFKSGRRYLYSGVPPEVYMAMRDARSRGAYFNAQIRDRYPYTLLERFAS